MRDKQAIVTVYGTRTGFAYDYTISLAKRNVDFDFFNAARLRHLGLMAKGEVREDCNNQRFNIVYL